MPSFVKTPLIIAFEDPLPDGTSRILINAPRLNQIKKITGFMRERDSSRAMAKLVALLSGWQLSKVQAISFRDFTHVGEETAKLFTQTLGAMTPKGPHRSH
jgi:hypothetical protein